MKEENDKKCPFFSNPSCNCMLVNGKEVCELAHCKSIEFVECFNYQNRKFYLANLERETHSK